MTQPPNLEALFHDARLIAPGPERDAFLDQVCEGRADLRAQLDVLLLADVHKEALLDRGPRPEQASAEESGQVVGRYKLLQRIGEGGFGTVWMAEQREPVRRRVALKVIKLGMDTKQVIARFEAERQALALMDHPNIAKVFDAGATESGRPFFVMELVSGMPIIEYCDHERLSTRERLQLFLQVCKAIQHAHQKGIIHRDIKPSNVLVTLHDGVPIPKVIDFGIAKATNQELTERTLFTEHKQILGTPAYMAPEQAEMSGLGVDTRADIYALGVLLYELLTGSTPIDVKALLAAGYDAMLRGIREMEPHKPSTRISSLGKAATSVAKTRRTDVSHLSSMLLGDLDWISMKCLEKDRNRRYETSSALAEDIQRHLDDETVLACPPSLRYRAGKFLRRHRVGLVSTGVVVLLLVLGLIGTTSGMLRAQRQLVRADEIKTLITEMITKVNPDEAMGMDRELLKQILQEAGERVDSGVITDELTRAELHMILGEAYSSIGLPDGVRHLEEARRILEERLGARNEDTLDACHHLARGYGNIGDTVRGVPLMESTLQARREVLGADSRETLDSQVVMAMLIARQGDLKRAEGTARDALERTERALGELDPVTLSAMHALSHILGALRELVEARELNSVLLARRETALGVEKRVTVNTRDVLCQTLSHLGELVHAERLALQNLEITERVFPEEKPRIAAIFTLGAIYHRSGRAREAIERLEECVALQEQLSKQNGRRPEPQTYAMLGSLYQDHGRFEDSLEVLAGLADHSRNSGAPPNGMTIGVLKSTTLSLEGLGRSSEARADRARWQEKSLQLAEEQPRAVYLTFAALSLLAEEGDALDDPQRARDLAREACEKADVEEKGVHGYALVVLSLAEERCGDRDAALQAAISAAESVPDTADEEVRAKLADRVRSLE